MCGAERVPMSRKGQVTRGGGGTCSRGGGRWRTQNARANEQAIVAKEQGRRDTGITVIENENEQRSANSWIAGCFRKIAYFRYTTVTKVSLTLYDPTNCSNFACMFGGMGA